MNPWYLLYRKSGYKSTIQRIESLGVKVFQPMADKVVPRKDCRSVRHSQHALFPSYLFLSFDINKVHTTTVTRVPGAVTFVRFDSSPCIVPPDVIQALKCQPYLVYNQDDTSVDYCNISPALMDSIQHIVAIPDRCVRETALMNLINALQNTRH
ncbi:transcriptional antiterminator NusG [Salmonella enterica subsp. enterica serovar Give]|nr:transcriptional antiterminator NusG [Salmonella enterica subsp. enterica serovar Give]EED4548125.1 transcriptional antiterminator NusG [Salmonella enterica subsp. enterica serovar Give]